MRDITLGQYFPGNSPIHRPRSAHKAPWYVRIHRCDLPREEDYGVPASGRFCCARNVPFPCAAFLFGAIAQAHPLPVGADVSHQPVYDEDRGPHLGMAVYSQSPQGAFIKRCILRCAWCCCLQALPS